MAMVLVLGLLANNLVHGPIGLPLGAAQVMPWLLFTQRSRMAPPPPRSGMELELRRERAD